MPSHATYVQLLTEINLKLNKSKTPAIDSHGQKLGKGDSSQNPQARQVIITEGIHLSGNLLHTACSNINSETAVGEKKEGKKLFHN